MAEDTMLSVQGARRRAEALPVIIANDIQKPLSRIQACAQFLLEDGALARGKDHLERIVACSRSIQTIIDDLTDAAAISQGSFSITKAKVPLKALLEEAISDLLILCAGQKEVTATLDAYGELPLPADARRLRQVLRHLLSNALRHVPSGTGRIEVAAHDLDREIIIEVADNGDGIEQGTLYGMIFGKSYQGMTIARGHLGLGLYLARRIVEGHGGRMWARSEGPGRGARFFFSIPKLDGEWACQTSAPDLHADAVQSPASFGRRGASRPGLSAFILPLCWALALAGITCWLSTPRGTAAGSMRPVELLRDAVGPRPTEASQAVWIPINQ